MKSYAIMRMRTECRVFYRLLVGESVVLLTTAAICGALWKAIDREASAEPLIMAGVLVALSVLLLGAYLVISDPKWMLRHTCFGKTLSQYGDSKALMAEIDQDAEKMDYECSGFALMRRWMVIYQCAPPSTFGAAQIRSFPIPKANIRRISWEKQSDEENAGFIVYVSAVDGTEYSVFIWEQADIRAIQAWSAVQETQTI